MDLRNPVSSARYSETLVKMWTDFQNAYTRPAVCIGICEYAATGRQCTCYRLIYAHGRPTTRGVHTRPMKKIAYLLSTWATSGWSKNQNPRNPSKFLKSSVY